MIEYRKMQEQDIESVALLEKQCFSQPWSYNAFKSALDDKNVLYIVAECEGSIVAQCGVRNIVGEGEITNVAVKPGYRKQGIAYAMLTSLLTKGMEMGISAFTLEVRSRNAAAIALYKKLGFVSEGIRPGFYTNPADDAMIMWKRLT